MHLINARTLQLQDSVGDHPTYVALSHTWGPEEVTFDEMASGKDFPFHKRGFGKIRACCAQALKYGYEWVWIDTCCIDKRSSAELSEAINSMYEWYQKASMCFAYLEDVRAAQFATGDLEKDLEKSGFVQSRWFTRGWTLQELIAPRHVEFFSQDWTRLGSKFGLRNLLSEITPIPLSVLSGQSIDSFNVAEKMSWAAYRNTTRIEDRAYCLLGIFNVHMPLIYGEGHDAFKRLQYEILRRREDLSIFLWAVVHHRPEPVPLLAPSPSAFEHSLRLIDYSDDCLTFEEVRSLTRISHLSGQQFISDRPKLFPDAVAPFTIDPPSITNRGLSISLNILHLKTRRQRGLEVKWAWTLYTLGDWFVCIRLHPQRVDNGIIHLRVGHIQLVGTSEIESVTLQAIYLALEPIDAARNHFTSPGIQVYHEPTVVLQGIQPTPAFTIRWKSLSLPNHGPQSAWGNARYTLKSSLSMEEHGRRKHADARKSTDPLSPEIKEIFQIVPKSSSNDKLQEGVAVVLGSLGTMLWCKTILVTHFPEALRFLEQHVQAELDDTDSLSDHATVVLTSGERVTAQIRPERNKGGVMAYYSYIVTMSVVSKGCR